MRCSAHMVVPSNWWGGGGVGSTSAGSAALMGCCCSWSLAMASWSCPLTLPCEDLTPKDRGGLELPPPIVVADSWCSDSKLMAHVSDIHQGTLLVQGKATYVFYLEDGRKVHGRDVIQDDDWPWQQSVHAPGCRYVRLRAKSPTYGAVTVIIVDKPADDRIYLFCQATEIQVTRLLRAWSRRNLIEQVFRILK